MNDSVLRIEQGVTKRTIDSTPPQHGKTTFRGKYTPAWGLLTNPARKIIFATYEQETATSWVIKAGNVIKDFADEAGVTIVKHNMDYIETSEGGFIYAVGIGGAITGKSADWFIIDDPVKNSEEAFSATMRNKVYDWYLSVASTRLSEHGAIMVDMTRWHTDDLVGRLLDDMRKGGEQWEYLSFPALAEKNDVLGREEGEPLFPFRYSKDYLLQMKRKMGAYFWSSMYQQNPVSAETQAVKEEYFRYYNELPQGGVYVQSYDTAFKMGDGNSFTVCVTAYLTSASVYIVDVHRVKIPFTELTRLVISKAEQYRPQVILIEDKASGQSLIQTLRMYTKLPIKAVEGSDDKVLRWNLVSPLFELGKVYLPNEICGWHSDFVYEVVNYPATAFKDQVVALSQLLFYIQKYVTRDVAASIPMPTQITRKPRERRERRKDNILKGF